MKILMVTSVYPRSDNDTTPAFIRHLAEGLVNENHEVTIICPHSRGCLKNETINGVHIRRHQYAIPESLQTLCYEGGMLVRLQQNPFRKLLLPFFALSQFLAIRCELKNQYDILHAHSVIPQGWIAALAKGNHNLPLLISSHGSDLHALKNKWSYFKSRAIEKCDGLILNSKFSHNEAKRQFPKANLHIIPACANEPNSSEPVSRRNKIVFVGRLIEEKGIFTLLEALELFFNNPENKSWTAEIAGTGPKSKDIQAWIETHELSQNIHLKGWIRPQDLFTFLQSAEILVMPSHILPSGWQEAQGLVAIEGLCAGLAVIVSQSGGLPEPIDNGVNGIILESIDPNCIAHHLSQITSNNHLRKTLQSNARSSFESNFKRQHNIDKTIELYQKTIATS